MRRFLICVVIAAVAALSLSACTKKAENDPTARARAVAQRESLTLGRQIDSRVVTLPEKLDYLGSTGIGSGFTWMLAQEACLAAGFDLTPYLGKQVHVASFQLRERLDGDKLHLEVVEYDDQVVGAYISVSGAIPRVESLTAVRDTKE